MQWAQNKAYVTVDLQKSDPPPPVCLYMILDMTQYPVGLAMCLLVW